MCGGVLCGHSVVVIVCSLRGPGGERREGREGEREGRGEGTLRWEGEGRKEASGREEGGQEEGWRDSSAQVRMIIYVFADSPTRLWHF